jgi:putative toxin-antitoxin system antitoxin component (TIGR02293 family)
MAKTIATKKGRSGKSVVYRHRRDGTIIDATIRFAEKREGRMVTAVKGKRFGTILKTELLDLDEWASVVYVSPRTLQNRIKANASFDPLQSERVELIVDVMDRGKEVFGDASKFRRWLDTTRPSLNGKKPIDMLGDLAGIGEVFAELGRVEHGVF